MKRALFFVVVFLIFLIIFRFGVGLLSILFRNWYIVVPIFLVLYFTSSRRKKQRKNSQTLDPTKEIKIDQSDVKVETKEK